MFRRLFKKKQTNSNSLLFFLKENFNIKPNNIGLYEQAFRHKSKSVIIDDCVNSNERLEYLGDAIISMIVADYLYKKYPKKSEGYLTKLRSNIVSRKNLNYYGNKINIEPLIDYKRGNNTYKSLLGNVIEAIIAAVYIDLGYSQARNVFINYLLEKYSDTSKLENINEDFKSQVIIYCQKFKKTLNFKLLNTFSKEDNPFFEIAIEINGEIISRASANSKIIAEQEASRKMLFNLELDKKHL